MPFTVADVFAGAGGFSLGFGLVGFDLIAAVEKDEWAAATLRHNHSGTRVEVADIRDLDDDRLATVLGTPDVVVGGPPCQGFSVCNNRGGQAWDERNVLFLQWVRAVRVARPKVAVMENVPAFWNKRMPDGDTAGTRLVEELGLLGYGVSWAILDAADFGVPQHRRRLFVLADRCGMERRLTEWPRALLPPPTVLNAIDDLPPVEAGGGAPVMDYGSQPGNPYQSMMRGGSNRLHNHTAMRHTKRVVERFRAMKAGEGPWDVEDESLRPRKRGSGEVSTTEYKQTSRRMHGDRPAPTIPASFYTNFVHPVLHRNLTPREGARLMSFPDTYIFKGEPTVLSRQLSQRRGLDHHLHLCQYQQIGNAVCPLVAAAIALEVGDALARGAT